MKIVFIKGSGKYDWMEISRDHAEAERIDCPKQGIIPHDMIHYAVEHALRTGGFLGRLKDGEGAGFRMKPEAESDAVERLVEVFQGDAWSGGSGSPEDLIAMYLVTCQARGCMALSLDHTAMQAIRSAIADLSNRWQAVPVGGALHLEL